MIQYGILLLLALPISLLAVTLEAEENFFGIPGLETLSTRWFIEQSDTSDAGFSYPTDIEVLKLADDDFRVIVLNADFAHFFAFRMDPVEGLSYGAVVRSGAAPDTCHYAVAMCRMQSGEYFDPVRTKI